MSAHLKAFAIVLLVSIVALAFFRKPFAGVVGRKHVDVWAVTWLVMTSCAFLLTNFWIFLFISAGVVFFLSRAEPVRPAIYLVLLCFAPTLGEDIPGFAGINKFIEVNPQLLVASIVLIPAMFASQHMRKLNTTGNKADLFFLLFLVLQIILSVRAESFTHMLRTAIQEFLAIAPIYYVFSRYPKSFADIRVLSAAFILPVIVLSAIAIPEFLQNWHYYNSVVTNWFGAVPFGYTLRDGYLRATTATYDPIVWGFITMSGIGLGLAVLNDGVSRFYRYAAFGLMVSGLIVSLSRGPWVGGVALFGVYILLSPKMMSRAIQAGFAGFIALAASLATPFGQNVVSIIPFIGARANSGGTISYRQELLDRAWRVMMENPFFGSADFLTNSNLQSLRQGQGIIDIVNTYLQVGLKSGLIGLSLFIGFFMSVLLALRKALKSTAKRDPLFANYCRAYLATLIGMLLTIFTTSSVGQIPHLYWTFAGIGVALARIAAQPAEHEQPIEKNQTTTPSEVYAWK